VGLTSGDRPNWDFFIVHAGPDREQAEHLFELLTPSARVFLSSRSLQPGDHWPSRLEEAQRLPTLNLPIISLKKSLARSSLLGTTPPAIVWHPYDWTVARR